MTPVSVRGDQTRANVFFRGITVLSVAGIIALALFAQNTRERLVRVERSPCAEAPRSQECRSIVSSAVRGITPRSACAIIRLGGLNCDPAKVRSERRDLRHHRQDSPFNGTPGATPAAPDASGPTGPPPGAGSSGPTPPGPPGGSDGPPGTPAPPSPPTPPTPSPPGDDGLLQPVCDLAPVLCRDGSSLPVP